MNAGSKLSSLGHRVFTAATFQEAAEVLRGEEVPVQLVIADHRMAGDGFAFILGLQHAFPDVKVCVLSQEISRSDVNQLNEAGILYFRKPVLLETVVKQIRIPPPVKKPAPAEPKREEGLLAQAEKKPKRGFTQLFFGKS